MYHVAVQIRLEEYRRHRDASHIMARGCLYIYIYIRNQHGTGMPDFWPIQLETGALPNVPFPPITLVFICLPTSRKLLMGSIVRSSIDLLTADESMSSLLVHSGFYHHSMGVIRFQIHSVL